MTPLSFDLKALASLDKVLHEPARLAVIACLAVVDEADFVFLQSQTGMTGGNLSSHVKKLEQAGYVEVQKEFLGVRPRTSLALSGEGKVALESYLQALRSLLAALDERKS